jgi:hypothetical protein
MWNCRYIGAVFCHCFVQLVGICSKELVGWITALDLTRPHGLVENATAPSAGGFPDGHGEGRLGKQLSFRTTSR